MPCPLLFSLPRRPKVTSCPRVLLLPILLTSFAQTTAPAPATCRSTRLQFSFAYPAEFRSADESESSVPAIEPSRPGSAVACISTPLIAEHHLNDSVGELISLTDLDFACLKEPTDPGKLDTFVAKVLMDVPHEDRTPSRQQAEPAKWMVMMPDSESLASRAHLRARPSMQAQLASWSNNTSSAGM